MSTSKKALFLLPLLLLIAAAMGLLHDWSLRREREQKAEAAKQAQEQKAEAAENLPEAQQAAIEAAKTQQAAMEKAEAARQVLEALDPTPKHHIERRDPTAERQKMIAIARAEQQYAQSLLRDARHDALLKFRTAQKLIAVSGLEPSPEYKRAREDAGYYEAERQQEKGSAICLLFVILVGGFVLWLIARNSR